MKKGSKSSAELKKKLSLAHLGLPSGNKGKKHSLESRIKMGKGRRGKKHTEEWKQKMSETMKKIGNKPPILKGTKSPNWKGGITSENVRIRTSIEYRFWVEANMARDNYTCQKYQIRGGKLAVHHILNFSQYPELRFAIDNGITLSEKAHIEFHKKYGRKNNTREQLEEFINKICYNYKII